ncbi:MAG: polysaccharide biosynthesis/export family protein [Rhodospirillaceae bacterium]|nr:polysaccharide biosynthesis/export family protein [Rhodospirillales bacterium]
MMKPLRMLLALVPVLALLACSGRVVQNPTPIAQAPSSTSSGYIIEPGDALDVRFFYNPELNEEVMVRPDGNISLPLVGEMRAAGRSPTQLEGLLRDSYSRELRQAAITVIVKGFAGQRVYVDGEVGEPQMVNIAGNLSAMQAVASAGGFKPSARKGEVLVIRRAGTPKPVVIPVDLDAAISGTDTSQDILLQPYDVVFVPKTAIAEVNQFVDQYFRQNIPLPVGVGYGINN